MLIFAFLAAIVASPTQGSRIKHLIGVDRAGSFTEIQQSDKDDKEAEHAPKLVAAAEKVTTTTLSSVAKANVTIASAEEANEAFGRLLEGLATSNPARSIRVTIQNIKFNEYLYSANFSLDADRRFVTTRTADAARDSEGQWQIQKLKGDTVMIKNVKRNEYLYANRPMVSANGTVTFNATDRRQVLTWKSGGFEEEAWLEGQWVLKNVKGDVWSIQNKAHNEYMYSSEYKVIANGVQGRAVLTWVPEGFDPADDNCRWSGTARWRIRTVSLADAMLSDQESHTEATEAKDVPTLPPEVLGDLPKARALHANQVEIAKHDFSTAH
eukprot:gnl/TRDRNA2_/TRDRNA2_183982_c0_seq1.p1 gnl/TRDRNA2_/TRDRNA2_183982_c0~~gnl/TRDRNA2_/TRDRNA2_183982_c0_seq1.p1  ORF type:complete len:325 (+),score=62.13 gnl/TRDRNA2_/TRDRNA2_183982_c0_seq1:58-1032(+)